MARIRSDPARQFKMKKDPPGGGAAFSVERSFTQNLSARLTDAKAAKVGGTVLFRIGTRAPETWRFDPGAPSGSHFAAGGDQADCTYVVPEVATWSQLVSGKLSATAAISQGKLRVEGDLTVGMKFERLVLTS
jgi:SCP-2 sterol transfer family protein